MKKRWRFAVMFFLCTVLLPGVLFAQAGRQGQRPASCLRPTCAPVEKLGLSEERRNSIDRIEKHYSDQILGLRNELMSKRFELQSVFRNPQADEQQVRARAREVAEIHNRWQAMMIDYQLEIRDILTPEQLMLWCASTDSCFIKGWSKEP